MGRIRGFTLIELMVVVAIVGILAAIAYPSYQAYVRAANRSAAQQYMLEISSRQQQYLLDNRQYATTLSALGMATVPDTVAGKYTVDFNPAVDNTATPPRFTIEATPVAGSVQAGESVLTLNSAGAKAPAGDWD